ncbi:mediator of RNA polymerase II transcription subunit 6-like [Actinia tenebrosa]|uniref:Mediator of RNA polymerase II transcription subunit 6 n=1 Tax=Actinia tenebrosa TaxID=6105 RepID=A0A6P8HXC8_ACTTE|nr:mediator of RNA polymerase II transcription subunit 6-like [Actinia tenebrosa]XP_031561030.1 mediator of RNA polymerase II transcription subunit 6-like [Actinia tenebrosa]
MAADTTENELGVSWHDSAWIPILNPANVLEYFSQRTNPFYDRTCNNEVVKMQRLDPSALQSMAGIEYEVIHVQDPILFVIRKQQRHSSTHVTPIADYYILAGIVYQAPDLGSVINSRMLSALHNFESAFKEAVSYSRYHQSKGYWWQFKDSQKNPDSKTTTEKKTSQASSLFQREGVNQLLGELSKRFPPSLIKASQVNTTTAGTATAQSKEAEEPGTETEATKDATSTDAAPVSNENTVNGLSNIPSSSISKTVVNVPVQGGVKRGADGVAKQPPLKKKKQ